MFSASLLMRPDEEVQLPLLSGDKTCKEMLTSQRSGYQLVLSTKCIKHNKNKYLIVHLGMGNTGHKH